MSEQHPPFPVPVVDAPVTLDSVAPIPWEEIVVWPTSKGEKE
jgi:hypothetical protein